MSQASATPPVLVEETRVGFVGLGLMGLPMARNLKQAGFDVAGWARRERTVERARAEGIETRPTLADLARDREFLVTMVTTSQDVVEVTLGEGGLLAAAPEGAVLIDMSTIAPATSREVAAACAARDIGFLDAPVSGGSFGAQAGTLTIMAGGDAAVLERARPLFEALGDPGRIFHTGPVGSGEIIKLVNNMLVGSISAATLEALMVGVGAGADLKTLVEVLEVSSGGSTQLSGQLRLRALAGEFDPGFMTRLLVKDMNLASDLARESGQATPLTDLARGLFEAAAAAGHADDDYSALLQEMEQASGTRLRLNS
ncbi:MAG: NAD(P)-dependent oxidoreductase [Candidatus Dormibacteraeota bacterium]|nr:NAD(P)-dependent oxidoreductase [Candidatus Dormibacteraeota bacterium]